MAIVKATLLTELNRRLERAETDIDWAIKDALLDLSLGLPVLIKNSTALTTVAGTAKYTTTEGLPADFRDVQVIRLYDPGDAEWGDPLIRLATWEEYKKRIEGETTADRDEPTHQIVHNKELYLWPTPDEAYTSDTDYSAIEDDPDNIELKDEYERCLIYGTNFFYLAGLDLADTGEGKTQGGLYENAKRKLIGLQYNREGPKVTRPDSI